MERKPSPFIWGIAALTISALLYLGLYLANVQATSLIVRSGLPPWRKIAEYRIGGQFSQVVFQPVHALDRKIRKEHWLDHGTSVQFIPPDELFGIESSP